MLWARGTRAVGPCSFASTSGLERSLRVHAIERRGLRWDTRFAPTKRPSGPEHPLLYVLLDGRISWRGGDAFEQGPGAVVLSSERYLDRGTEDASLVAEGEPFRAIEVFIDAAFVPAWPTAPRAITAKKSLQTASRVFDALAHDDAATPALLTLLDALADDGVVDRKLAATVQREESSSLLRAWTAVAEQYLRVAPAPSLQELADATGLSVRQLTRDLGMLLETFFLGADRYRDAVSDTRLRLAVLLLSAKEIAIAEVARSAGYGSIQALGRAFRDGDLPPPSVVRKELLGGLKNSFAGP